MHLITGRRSHRRCSVEKGVLKNFAIFTGKRLCQILFLIKLKASLKPATLLKKRLQHRCFPVMFFCECCEIFKNTYFVEHLRTAVFALGTDAIEHQNINEKN